MSRCKCSDFGFVVFLVIAIVVMRARGGMRWGEERWCWEEVKLAEDGVYS